MAGRRRGKAKGEFSTSSKIGSFIKRLILTGEGAYFGGLFGFLARPNANQFIRFGLGRFIFFPVAAGLSIIKIGFSIHDLATARNKNAGRVTTLLVDIALSALIVTAVVGGLVATAVFATISPFLLVAMMSVLTAVSLISTIYNGIMWARTKDPEAIKIHKNNFKQGLIWTGIFLATTVGMALLMVFHVVPAVMSWVLAGLNIAGFAYGVWGFIAERKAQKAAEKAAAEVKDAKVVTETAKLSKKGPAAELAPGVSPAADEAAVVVATAASSPRASAEAPSDAGGAPVPAPAKAVAAAEGAAAVVPAPAAEGAAEPMERIGAIHKHEVKQFAWYDYHGRAFRANKLEAQGSSEQQRLYLLGEINAKIVALRQVKEETKTSMQRFFQSDKRDSKIMALFLLQTYLLEDKDLASMAEGKGPIPKFSVPDNNDYAKYKQEMSEGMKNIGNVEELIENPDYKQYFDTAFQSFWKDMSDTQDLFEAVQKWENDCIDADSIMEEAKGKAAVGAGAGADLGSTSTMATMAY